MVWFQCEDCGENLKKPKLPNHFRICSASKLSCIDCGVIFGQESVQSHTQCITETEKYGPKGPGKVQSSSNAKPNKDAKQQPDVDINVGLSERPPWFCSLCNTKATSKQTLLLHAEGKKHRAKARAFHAKQEPQQMEEGDPESKAIAKDDLKGEMIKHASAEQPRVSDSSEVGKKVGKSEAKNGNIAPDKKRKRDIPVDNSTAGDDISAGAGNGEVIQAKNEKAYESKKRLKKAKSDAVREDLNASTKEDAKKNIKWKKLLTSALKSNADGALKMRKLKKHVLQALKESGVNVDEDELSCELERKIASSSRFMVENKYVRLVAKDRN